MDTEITTSRIGTGMDLLAEIANAPEDYDRRLKQLLKCLTKDELEELKREAAEAGWLL